MAYHVEIKDSTGKVVRGIVAATQEEALTVQRQFQGTPLVPPGGSVTIRADAATTEPPAKPTTPTTRPLTKRKAKPKAKPKTKKAKGKTKTKPKPRSRKKAKPKTRKTKSA